MFFCCKRSNHTQWDESLACVTQIFDLTVSWFGCVQSRCGDALQHLLCKPYTVTVVVLMLLLVAALVSELCGETVASRCSLFWEQLQAHSWQEAQKELQQGRRRQTLTLHRNQPGDQQHQHSRTKPIPTPRATYRARGDTGESGGQIIGHQNSEYNQLDLPSWFCITLMLDLVMDFYPDFYFKMAAKMTLIYCTPLAIYHHHLPCYLHGPDILLSTYFPHTTLFHPYTCKTFTDKKVFVKGHNCYSHSPATVLMFAGISGVSQYLVRIVEVGGGNCGDSFTDWWPSKQSIKCVLEH